jgi:hypothetical protein
MGRRRAALEEPASGLSERLGRAGRPDLGASLAELIPAAAIANDEHLSLLGDRLARIAGDLTVEQSERDEAGRLAAIAADLPSGIGRTGVVWIAWWEPRAWHVDVDPAHYGCHWEPSFDDQDEDRYEDGPEFDTLDEALTWARRRSGDIVVRPAWDRGSTYWAGDGPCPGGRFPPLVRRA